MINIQITLSLQSLSMVSFWEITIKQSIGKLNLSLPLDEIYKELSLLGINFIQISIEHLSELKVLPHEHKDPFDRLLISQAITEKMTVLTTDSKFKLYPNKLILN